MYGSEDKTSQALIKVKTKDFTSPLNSRLLKTWADKTASDSNFMFVACKVVAESRGGGKLTDNSFGALKSLCGLHEETSN